MAWDGCTQYDIAPNNVAIKMHNFDADAENTGTIDIFKQARFFPKIATWIVRRTTGSTALISVKLEGSVDNNTWTALGTTVTAKDTEDGWNIIDANYSGAITVGFQYRYLKWTVTTVGSGNTLDIYALVSG